MRPTDRRTGVSALLEACVLKPNREAPGSAGIRIRLEEAFCVKTARSHPRPFRPGKAELQRTRRRRRFSRASKHAPLRRANHRGRECLRRTLRRRPRPRRGEFQAQQASTERIVSFGLILSPSGENPVNCRGNLRELPSPGLIVARPPEGRQSFILRPCAGFSCLVPCAWCLVPEVGKHTLVGWIGNPSA